MVAFAIAGGVFVLTIVISIIVGVGAVPFTQHSGGGFHYNLVVGTGNATETALAIVNLVQWVLGTALGIFAFIVGIVAVAQRRGRGWGVAAIVFAALGPAATVSAVLTTVAVNVY